MIVLRDESIKMNIQNICPGAYITDREFSWFNKFYLTKLYRTVMMECEYDNNRKYNHVGPSSHFPGGNIKYRSL